MDHVGRGAHVCKTKLGVRDYVVIVAENSYVSVYDSFEYFADGWSEANRLITGWVWWVFSLF